jgi:hypothetical protein
MTENSAFPKKPAIHGGKSTGPRTEGLERSRRHGHYSREAKAEQSRLRAAMLAVRYLRDRSERPRGPAVGYGPPRTIYLAGRGRARPRAQPLRIPARSEGFRSSPRTCGRFRGILSLL